MNFSSPEAQALETATATQTTTQPRRDDNQQQRVHYTNEVSYMYSSNSTLAPLLESNDANTPPTCSPLPSIKQALTIGASMHTSGPSPPSVLLASTLSPQHGHPIPVSACIPHNAPTPLPPCSSININSTKTLSNNIIPPVTMSLPASISSPITNNNQINTVRNIREGTSERTGGNQASAVQALSPRLGVSYCLPNQSKLSLSTSQPVINDRPISRSNNRRRQLDKEKAPKKQTTSSTPYLTALLQARAAHEKNRFNETRLKHHITDPIRGCRSISNEARERVRTADAVSNQPGTSSGTLVATASTSNRSNADHPSLPPTKRKRSSISLATTPPGVTSTPNVVGNPSIVPGPNVVTPNALVGVTTPDLTVGLPQRHDPQPTQLKIAVEFSMTSGTMMRATWIAAELLNEFHTSITEVSLVPRPNNHIFNIWISGKMAWSRGEGQPLPDYAHLQPIVRAQCRQAGL